MQPQLRSVRCAVDERWRRRGVLVALCCACSLSSLSAIACTSESVGSVVRAFYESAGHPPAVPLLADLAARRYTFSQRLEQLLRAAAIAREEFIRVFPDRRSPDGELIAYKPPFVDGDIFQGEQDGARGFEVSEVRAVAKGRWSVRVRSTEELGMSPWAVTVRVVQESERCVIDDVIYGSRPGAQTLTQSLRRQLDWVRVDVAEERKRVGVRGH